MNFLFLHPNFPSQFRDLAATLARDAQHRVVFLTARTEGELPGVRKFVYPEPRPPGRKTHPYLVPFEQAVLHGQAAYRLAHELKKSGFTPDVVLGHSGFGPTLFMRDLFPRTPLLCQFEWFYRARGSDADFDPADPLSADTEARIRVKNAAILTDLAACDAGCAPTHWQRQQFPGEFHSKIEVIHEGIDTDYFSPETPAPSHLSLPRIGLELPEGAEIMTYVARGMEPYRGFPQFIAAAHQLLARRPECHVVIVGDDRVAYGKSRADGRSYKTAALEEYPLDPARVHFTGLLPYREYRQVLRASSVHVYLTRPFVLSWSLLEAMACGCLVVASDTAPVREVIEDGRNGLLTDFFDPNTIAGRIAEALDRRVELRQMRAAARQTVVRRYASRDLLPARLRWVARFAGNR